MRHQVGPANEESVDICFENLVLVKSNWLSGPTV